MAEGVPERIEANAIISSSNNRDNNIDYGGMRTSYNFSVVKKC